MKFNRKYSLRELLLSVDYCQEINGNLDDCVDGFSDDFFAKNGDLTWTDNIFILKKMLSDNNQLSIITNHHVQKRFDRKNIICCSNPLRLFEAIIDRVFTYPSKEVEIGENSTLHQTVTLGKNVKIGNNCSIAPFVVIGDNVKIGDNVIVEPFTVIGNNPFYVIRDQYKRLRNRTLYGSVEVGNNVRIGSHCSIDNGITGKTIIGSGCRLGNFIEIGHDVIVGKNCCFIAQTAIAGYVSIGNDCVFWAKAGVSNRIQIASHTTLLASSILTKSVMTSGLTLCGFPAIDKYKYWKKIAKERNV